MDETRAARRTTHRTLGPAAVGLVAVVAAITGILVYQSASSSAFSSREARAPGADPALPLSPASPAPSSTEALRGHHAGATTEVNGAATEDDGVLPDRVTVFDDEYPGVANLDPDLLRALRKAAMDAADDGVGFNVNSGWRSPAYQNQLLREAISRYGSQKKAARWVASADTSAHVSGHAVDIEADAAAWLSDHGARYGLCQIYSNESWHFELRPKAIDRGCPPAYADPAHDPNVQR